MKTAMDEARGRRGFTLIEVLVVIGVIGVLLGLLLPALRGVRGSALQTVALANVRSVQQVMTVYGTDHGRNPFRGLGEAPAELYSMIPNFEPEPNAATYVWYPEGVVIATTGHFEQQWLWPSIVLPLEDWPEHWETWQSPRRGRELPTIDDFSLDEDSRIEDQISVRYSNAFVARPEFFTDDPVREMNPAQLRATRPSDVRYPSAKVMLWDDDLSYVPAQELTRVDGLLDASTPMAFADGHGAVRNPQEASDAVRNALTGDSLKLADTEKGVHGRDYQDVSG